MASNLKLFREFLQRDYTQNYLQEVLGEHKAEFVSNVTSLVQNNKKLQECEPQTIMYAGIKATTLGLSLDPNLGFAHAIPYKNTKDGIVEAQFQIGYKGIAQLAIRSGQFKTINVTDVREGELKSRDRRTGYVTIEWIQNDKERDAAPIIGYLGYFKLLNGYEKESYWSMEELKNHGLHYSQSFKQKYGVWVENFDAMAKKTVLKLMLNKGDAPMSVQMQQAVKYDQSVILNEQGDARYIDNQQPTTEDKMQRLIDAEDAQIARDVQEEQSATSESGDLFGGKE